MQWWVSQASSPGLAHSKCGVHLYCRKDAKTESRMGPLPCSPLFALSEIVHRLKYPWPHGIDFASCLKPEKAMAAHSSTLAWNIPWTEAPGRLQSMGWLGVSLDWATSLSRFTFLHWRRKWQPTPVFFAWRIPGTGEPGGLPSMGSHSRTRLKWLSSSSCSMPEAGEEKESLHLKGHLSSFPPNVSTSEHPCLSHCDSEVQCWLSESTVKVMAQGLEHQLRPALWLDGLYLGERWPWHYHWALGFFCWT